MRSPRRRPGGRRPRHPASARRGRPCRTSVSSSCRLTTARSASTAMGRAGAALRQKSPVHSSHAARTASSGISSWQRTASCGGRSTAPRVAFAPGATAIVVSPSASTWISATPVGASLSCSTSSTPAARRPASASSACGSRPTAAIIVTFAPSRAQATAWFAPFPPGTRLNAPPPTVSPGSGNRSTRTTRSRLTEPTTTILGGTCASSHRQSLSVLPARRPQAGGGERGPCVNFAGGGGSWGTRVPPP